MLLRNVCKPSSVRVIDVVSIPSPLPSTRLPIPPPSSIHPPSNTSRIKQNIFKVLRILFKCFTPYFYRVRKDVLCNYV